jgi:hypothetical protein
MEKKHMPKEKLLEEKIVENADLVSEIKTAVSGQPMSPDQFKEWLSKL